MAWPKIYRGWVKWCCRGYSGACWVETNGYLKPSTSTSESSLCLHATETWSGRVGKNENWILGTLGSGVAEVELMSKKMTDARLTNPFSLLHGSVSQAHASPEPTAQPESTPYVTRSCYTRTMCISPPCVIPYVSPLCVNVVCIHSTPEVYSEIKLNLVGCRRNRA